MMEDIKQIIREINAGSERATRERILEACSRFETDESTMDTLLEEAVESKHLKHYKYAGIFSYKIVDEQNTVTIQDPVDQVSTQTEVAFITKAEFEEFKETANSLIQTLQLEVVKLRSEL